MTILTHDGVLQATMRRLKALRPDAQRRWGRMSVGGMLCHLNDAYVGVMSLGIGSAPVPWAGRMLLRPFALHTSLNWPHGVPTPREVDQLHGGTPPAEFEADRARLLDSLERFAATDMAGKVHPIFGPLTQWEWMRWGWMHSDHHLRQFSN